MFGGSGLGEKGEVAVRSATLVDASNVGGLDFLCHGRILGRRCHRGRWTERERDGHGGCGETWPKFIYAP